MSRCSAPAGSAGTPASPLQGDCEGEDLDWQKAIPALSRVAGRYGEALVSAGGDRGEAASLLWKRSRHDEALREDLVKAACALFALAPAAVAGDPPSGWRRPPGPLSRLDRDPEVGAFVRERLGTVPVAEIVRQLNERFGPERAPGKTTIWRWWRRLDRERQKRGTA